MNKYIFIDYLRIFGFANFKRSLKKYSMFFVILLETPFLVREWADEFSEVYMIISAVIPIFLTVYTASSKYCDNEPMIYLCPLSAEERYKLSLRKYIFKITVQTLFATLLALVNFILYDEINVVFVIMCILGNFSLNTFIYHEGFFKNEKRFNTDAASFFTVLFSVIYQLIQVYFYMGEVSVRSKITSVCVYLVVIVPITLIVIAGNVKDFKERAKRYDY